MKNTAIRRPTIWRKLSDRRLFLLSINLSTSGKINAIGFNFFDNYLYDWGFERSTLVRIGDDYQATPIALDFPF